MTDYTKSEREQQILATEAAIAEFLARGGKIQVVPPGKSGYVEGSGSAWGRKKKTAAPVEEVVEDTAAEEEIPEAEPEEVTGDEVVFTFDDEDDEEQEQE